MRTGAQMLRHLNQLRTKLVTSAAAHAYGDAQALRSELGTRVCRTHARTRAHCRDATRTKHCAQSPRAGGGDAVDREVRTRAMGCG